MANDYVEIYVSPVLADFEGQSCKLPWSNLAPEETPACANCPASCWMLTGRQLVGLRCYCALLGETTWDKTYLVKPLNHDSNDHNVAALNNTRPLPIRYCDGQERAIAAMKAGPDPVLGI